MHLNVLPKLGECYMSQCILVFFTITVLYCLCDPASFQVSAGNRITDFEGRKPFTELQIRGNIEDTCNLKIFFLISQQKHML